MYIIWFSFKPQPVSSSPRLSLSVPSNNILLGDLRDVLPEIATLHRVSCGFFARRSFRPIPWNPTPRTSPAPGTIRSYLHRHLSHAVFVVDRHHVGHQNYIIRIWATLETGDETRNAWRKCEAISRNKFVTQDEEERPCSEF